MNTTSPQIHYDNLIPNLIPNLLQPSIPSLLILPVLFILVHLVPYLYDPHGLRSYPGPFLAKFSDAWLGVVSKNGHRSELVHEMHLKYGA